MPSISITQDGKDMSPYLNKTRCPRHKSDISGTRVQIYVGKWVTAKPIQVRCRGGEILWTSAAGHDMNSAGHFVDFVMGRSHLVTTAEFTGSFRPYFI